MVSGLRAEVFPHPAQQCHEGLAFAGGEPVHCLGVQTPRLLVTPHMASSVSPEAMARQIVGDTARVLAGQAPVHAIDRGRGY